MKQEIQILLATITGTAGASLAFWAGWQARGMARSGVIGQQPLIFNEGHTQRGNGSGGPTTPKPEISPAPHSAGGRWHQWMHDLRPDLTRRPFISKPQFPAPRRIREDFLP